MVLRLKISTYTLMVAFSDHTTFYVGLKLGVPLSPKLVFEPTFGRLGLSTNRIIRLELIGVGRS